MAWNRLYLLTSYLKSSLWVVPFAAIPLELVVTQALHIFDPWLGWRLLNLSAPGAKSVLETIVSASLSFAVFTFGFLLVAIQVASGQLTPRIIATTLLRDNVVRLVVGLFIFTLLLAGSALSKMQEEPAQLVMFVVATLGVLCFAAFLYVIDYAARLLRPITILTRLGARGIEVIEAVYPELDFEAHHASDTVTLQKPERVVRHQGASEIVIAVNAKALKAAAAASRGVIEFVPQVGDFVATGEPLFNLYGAAKALDGRRLRAAVAFGPERTLEQDPTFAFRVIIDIGVRALSQAINDPTTAVLALDQLHRLLRTVGQRNLRTDDIVDVAGQLRVVLRTPNWEDFVHLSFTEMRRGGSDQIQVVRRLRSTLENLLQILPEHRCVPLRQEVVLLEREIGRHFTTPVEAELARVPDRQGLGGYSGRQPRP
jgi:uncharacterized membrane protein